VDNLYYPNGAIYCRVQEDRKEYFYEDGVPKTVEHYKAGKLDGESVLYWPNGKVKRKCTFSQGVRHGLDQMWTEEGILADEGHYKKGKPVGTHRRFHPKGALLEEIVYLDASRFNLRGWDEQGELKLEAVWIDPDTYREKAWDRFQNVWIEKEGHWDGKKLVYV
jgi:antitoxin component YwqK of YwqJK toxin-antitoxin module